MVDETDDEEYKTVYGVKFRDPGESRFGLNEESVWDDYMKVMFIALSWIPILGFVFGLSMALVGFEHRHENDYRIDEQFWRAGVIAFVVHAVSLVALALYTMV